jgi:hypothetical protein
MELISLEISIVNSGPLLVKVYRVIKGVGRIHDFG